MKKLILILFIFLLNQSAFSQIRKNNFIRWPGINADVLNAPLVFNKNSPGIFSSKFFSPKINTASLCVNFEIPRGAIFCRMEKALMNKSNIWIKFRAGDEKYYSGPGFR
ncbi:MAG: hypothetical protein IAF38_16260 [Bacteroidia bacterium]|nr:hypothetical protein [Bacteroidia bacterium]